MKKYICIVYGYYKKNPLRTWNVKAFMETESALGFKTVLENDYENALVKHKGVYNNIKKEDLPNDAEVCLGDSRLIYDIEDLELGDPHDTILHLCKIINKE